MGRISRPGLLYFNIDCGFTRNKKVRLLFNQYGADGVWVWLCILDYSYEVNGYYFDLNDKDNLELFSIDVCRMPVERVKEIIIACVNRTLFDTTIYENFFVLTSIAMQEFYLKATSERRRKKVEVFFEQSFLLVDVEKIDYVKILPRKNSINPRKNSNIPRINPQSKVKESKEKERDAQAPTHSQDLIDKFDRFKCFIEKNAPNVAKMKEPFTIEQYQRIVKDFQGKNDLIRDVLMQMHNKKDLIKKYTSANLTLRNWIRMRKEKSTDSNGTVPSNYAEERAKMVQQTKELAES